MSSSTGDPTRIIAPTLPEDLSGPVVYGLSSARPSDANYDPMTASDDPAVIHTLVVSATDLVAALEAVESGDEPDAVLRVTPPYSGRMRARLHVDREPVATEPHPVTLAPSALVDDDCPDPPHPDEVADALRADETAEYTVDEHHDRYRSARRAWRRRVPAHVRDAVSLPDGSRDVTVRLLGDIED